MKSRHIFVLVSIIFFSVSQSANSSVRAAIQHKWSFFNPSLELNFNSQPTEAPNKNKYNFGWQFNEPKLTRTSPTLILPNYEFELIDIYNFESSLSDESPKGGWVRASNFNALNNQIKTINTYELDIPNIELENHFYTYVSLQRPLFRPTIKDAAPSPILDDSFLLQNYPEALKPIIALVKIGDQKLQLYERGKFLIEWEISSARAGKVTPKGTWTAKWLSKNHKSSIYDGAAMPYSVFFNGDYAIHGTHQIDQLGEPASAGCVRLHPQNAKILFDLTMQYGVENTLIKIVH
jgi:hypothetical protein